MKKLPQIIIVDDDSRFCIMLSTFLQKKGVGIIKTYNSSEDCLAQLLEKPKVMLIDYSLPGINGIELMQKIKTKYPDVIFLFLSGQTDIAVTVKALQNGATDYIVKDDFSNENALFRIIQALCLENTKYEYLFYKITFLTTLILMVVVIIYLLTFTNLRII